MPAAESREVSADEGGQRLDRWFRKHFPDVPNARLQRWLRTGQVRVDGHRVKGGTRLEAGQSVRVPPRAETRPGAEPAPPAKIADKDRAELAGRILYRDEDVLVLDKPPGLAVQGGTGTRRHLDAMLDGLCFGGERPRLVHRLDRDTSGVLVLARSAAAAAALAAAFRSKRTRKLYWAIVVGVPRGDKGRIDLRLAKQPGRGGERVHAGREDGQSAVTDYAVIERAGRKAAWLALEPITGRTHQLRVHCAAMGTPILGDFKYGGRAASFAGSRSGLRLHLLARALSVPHPAGGVLEVEAPLPEHMRETWTLLGFDVPEAAPARRIATPSPAAEPRCSP